MTKYYCEHGYMCSVPFFELAWISTSRTSGRPERPLVEIPDVRKRDQGSVIILVSPV